MFKTYFVCLALGLACVIISRDYVIMYSYLCVQEIVTEFHYTRTLFGFLHASSAVAASIHFQYVAVRIP